MNAHERTHRRGPARAIHGARAGRQHLARTAALDAQLHRIAPGTAEIRTVPATLDDEPCTRVLLINDLAQQLIPTADARAAALRLLRHFFPDADWTAPQRYTVRTGQLALDEPVAPAALGLDTATGARR
ncbi:hypothetical protein MHW47_10725 [Streptomyces sp. OfavH-34-F]|uniref:hypothetical protein n=1 Tax=Streptomyces sp. OfavH-34-F TaxID=2917760 RepID=UPI001EF2665C|nr:hypothetical protein [Streptomyces sp. OfavH-34-F]MCG7524907.1 hypothetical protein [Streptomyces sp. OfavH-34-F]